MEIKFLKPTEHIICLNELMNEITDNSIICFKYDNNIYIIKEKRSSPLYQCISLNLKSNYHIPDTLKNIIEHLLELDYEIYIFNEDFSNWILNSEELKTIKKPKILKEKHLIFLKAMYINNKFNLHPVLPYFIDKFPDLTEKESNDIVQYWLKYSNMLHFRKMKDDDLKSCLLKGELKNGKT